MADRERKRPRSAFDAENQENLPPPSQDTDLHSKDDEQSQQPQNFEAEEAPEPFAEEEELIPDVDDIPLLGEDEEDGEDLFGDGMEDDYKENDRLDNYDLGEIDDDDYDQMDARERARVEREMRRRDVMEGRLPAAFLDDQDDYEEDLMTRRRRRRQLDAVVDDDEEEEEDLLLENLHDLKGLTIPEWVSMDRPRNTIKKEFKNFLLSYVDENGHSVYGERVKVMCEANSESLEVSYMHLQSTHAILAYLLANAPTDLLKIFDEVAFEVVQINFEEYDQIHKEIHVRITDLPSVLTLRDLRQQHLNSLVRVSGVVTRRTAVFPQLKYVKYDCTKCGAVLGPFHQDVIKEISISRCSNCNGKGPFRVNSEQTVYRNYQKLTLQESPGTVPAGRLPRHKEVILLWDLIDSARPGEEIEVIGIYRNNFDRSLNLKNGFPVFATVLEANHISKKEDMFASVRLSEDDVKKIKELSKDPRIGKRIIKSMAPSIYGHEDIKTGIALSLFGGVPKNIKNKHRIRGDINLLMLGDPGTAKSQFLKYIEKTAHRAVFTTGQGASAVGLTASVRKDPISREWTLEGGALVLADKGVCLIDEFDKMGDADRTSIHEAMEQQSISISKAGIVTSLQARCAIIAAANPIRGRYNPQITFSQNVDLTEPILSRFDILCVVKDRVDPTMDELLARFVVESHIRSHPTGKKGEEGEEADTALRLGEETEDKDLIPQDLLKKYLMYAKEKVHPKSSNIDEDKIAKLYAEIRRESLATGSIPITVRHLESVIRMAEAHARMHLRDYVRSDDVDMGIRVLLESFISAQKISVMKQLRKAFSKYITFNRDNDELLYFILSDLTRDAVTLFQYRNPGTMPKAVAIREDDLVAKAQGLNIHDVRPFFKSHLFLNNGYRFNADEREIVKRLR